MVDCPSCGTPHIVSARYVKRVYPNTELEPSESVDVICARCGAEDPFEGGGAGE